MKRSRSEAQVDNAYSRVTARPKKDFFGKPSMNMAATKFTLKPSRNGGGLKFGNMNRSVLAPRDSRQTRQGIANYSDSPLAGGARRVSAGNMSAGSNSGYGVFGMPDMSRRPTIGFMSNHTVSGNMTVMKARDARDEVPGRYDVVIIEKSPDGIGQNFKSTASGYIVDDTPRTSYTLASFNHYIASMQNDVRHEILPLKKPGVGEVNWLDPRSIMANFYIYGIVEAEESTSNFSTAPYVARTDNYSGSEMRKSGVVISGRHHCYNVWGPNLPTSTYLFFILKRVPRPTGYITNAYRTGQRTVKTFSEREKTVLDPNPFQLVPFACTTRSPPRSELIYTDHLGVERLAPYVLFGSVFKYDAETTHQEPMSIARDISLIRNQGLIDIIVHV